MTVRVSDRGDACTAIEKLVPILQNGVATGTDKSVAGFGVVVTPARIFIEDFDTVKIDGPISVRGFTGNGIETGDSEVIDRFPTGVIDLDHRGDSSSAHLAYRTKHAWTIGGLNVDHFSPGLEGEGIEVTEGDRNLVTDDTLKVISRGQFLDGRVVVGVMIVISGDSNLESFTGDADDPFCHIAVAMPRVGQGMQVIVGSRPTTGVDLML